MKIYYYSAPVPNNPNNPLEWEEEETWETEEHILSWYFPIWAKQMKDLGQKDLISKENCLNDFKAIHWIEETDITEQ